jgi:hypothetical protein
MREIVRPSRFFPGFLLLVLSGALAPRIAQAQSPEEIVRTVVRNELDADTNDRTAWMYRDAYKSPDKNIVKLIIETQQGNLSEVVEDNGHPPSAEQHQADLDRIRQMLTDPAFRQRLKRNEQQDSKQARDMMNMLPNAFIWNIVDRGNGDVKLTFRPNPSFSPDGMNGKVLAAMSGTLVVSEHGMRLRSLSGHLDKDVVFAWGLLGRINAGGTFQIIREEVGTGNWQITQTHVHISGHALFFKNIGDQEDEVTSDYRRTPEGVDLNKAAQMLRDGEVARELHIETHFGA